MCVTPYAQPNMHDSKKWLCTLPSTQVHSGVSSIDPKVSFEMTISGWPGFRSAEVKKVPL